MAAAAPAGSVGARRRRGGLGVLTAATVAFVAVWVSVGTLEVVSRTSGLVVPVSQVRKVQHLEGGIVSEILVEEGQRVDQHQVLVALDLSETEIRHRSLLKQIDALEVDGIRFAAEVAGADRLEVPEALERQAPEAAADATDVFEARREHLRSRIAVQEELVEQRRLELAQINGRLEANRRTKALVDEQVGISEALLQRDVTNRMTHLELLRQQSEIDRQLEEDRALAARTRSMLDESRERIVSIRAEFEEEARTRQEDVRRRREVLLQEARRLEEQLQRADLRAPVAGVVKTLRVSSIGDVVSAGDVVAEIVPGEDRLVVDAQLPVQDIGYVEPGQKAKLRLMSSDAQRFGAISGVVTKIAPDAVITDGGIAFYEVSIVPDSPEFASNNRIYRLYPGMKLDVSIIIGERSIWNYFVDPLLSASEYALQEP